MNSSLTEEQMGKLKDFVVSELVKTKCNADPSVLSVYIGSLAEGSMAASNSREYLHHQLREFLFDETESFVESLLLALQNVIDGNDINSRHNSQKRKLEISSNLRGDVPGYHPDEEQREPALPRSRHRRERDRGREWDRDSSSRRHDYDVDRPLSASREREHSSSRERESFSSSRDRDREEGREDRQHAPRPEECRVSRDRRYRNNDTRGGERKRRLCQDFAEQGICMRGDVCEFEHISPLVVDEARLAKIQSGKDDDGAYNPEDPFLNKPSPIPVWSSRNTSRMGGGMRGAMGPGLLSLPHTNISPRIGNHGVAPALYGDGLMHPSGGSSVFQGRPRGIRARPRGRGGYQTRSSFEEDGIGHTITDTATLGNNRYNDHQAQGGSGGRGGFNRFKRGRYDSGYDNNQGTRPPKPTTDSICVTRIPPELNTIDKLNEHFKKFGSIVNIQLDPANGQAFVQFTSHEGALLALRSPEAVMGNRFIHVYLRKDEPAQQPSQTQPSTPKTTPPKPLPTSTRLQPPLVPKTPMSLVYQTVGQPANVGALQKEREFLDQKKKQFLALLEQDDPAVKDKLSPVVTANINEVDRKLQEVAAKLRSAAGAAAPSKVESSPESAKPQEASSEAGQAPTGVSPANELALSTLSSPPPVLKAPGRGRGRGIRARGSPWWGRGWARGRGRGYAPTAPRAFKLDNRTTVICIHNMPQELGGESLLRSHFQTFGEVVSLAPQPGTQNYLVQYAQRYMAEMAIQKGRIIQGQTFVLSWHDSTQSDSATEENGEPSEKGVDPSTEDDFEEYLSGDAFTEEQFGITEEEELDEDKERSWKRD